MKVVEISSTDLSGRIFNGHDLQLSLKVMGIDACQMVMSKTGCEDTTLELCSRHEMLVRSQLTHLELSLGMNNLLAPFGNNITDRIQFEEADVVHYHLVHNNVLSMLDLKKIFSLKPTVWTIHDPWVVGGHCIYPLDCDKWRSGCTDCPELERPFIMGQNQSASHWKIKKDMMSQLDCDIIVSTDWMMSYIQESPLTRGLKHIHKIPFGIHMEKYEDIEKRAQKKKWGLPVDDIVITFRADRHAVKGFSYIVNAIMEIPEKNISILTVGKEELPPAMVQKFRVLQLGWQGEQGVLDCLRATDIFLMPSLAESFGMMAIEAMAAECAVVVFKDTVLEQITCSPECGIAVPLKDVRALRSAIQHLIHNKEERIIRGKKGKEIVRERYQYDNYVNKHIDVYERAIHRQSTGHKDILWNGYTEEKERHGSMVKENMELIRAFKNRLQKMSNNHAEKTCIFCAGIYGAKTYWELKDRLVEIDYVIDNDSEKWGSWVDGITCFGMEHLRKDREKVLVIVCNKNGAAIVQDLKKLEFPYVITMGELDALMMGVPKYEAFGGFAEIADLDYSSVGVRALIDKFNHTIYDVCKYYEEKL